VGTVDETTTDIDGGAVPSVHVQGIGSCGGAGDIYDGIHCAHFMKVNFFDRNAVDAPLGLG
jgi:hypothetical protein